jgi:predicted kinase
LKIDPKTGNVGAAIQEAQLRMKTMMAAGQDFVLNNTCIDANARQRWLGLCYAYNARVKAVYIERTPGDLFRQNRERPFDEVVPDVYLNKQISKFSPPTPLEAHEVVCEVPEFRQDFDASPEVKF